MVCPSHHQTYDGIALRDDAEKCRLCFSGAKSEDILQDFEILMNRASMLQRSYLKNFDDYLFFQIMIRAMYECPVRNAKDKSNLKVPYISGTGYHPRLLFNKQ
jgi:hypothetical protein